MDISSISEFYTEAEQLFDKFLGKIDGLLGVKDVIEADFGVVNLLEFDFGDVDTNYQNLLIAFNNDNYTTHLYKDIINLYDDGGIDCVIINVPVKKFDSSSLVSALIDYKFYIIHNIVHYLDFKKYGQYEWKDLDTEKKLYNSIPEFKAFYLEAMYKFCHNVHNITNVEDLKFKLRNYLPNKFRTFLTDKNKVLFNDLTEQFYSTLK